MRRFILSLPTVLVLLSAVSATAQNRSLFPRFTVTAGGYGTNWSTDVQLGIHGAEDGGTEVNFEEDAALDSSMWVGRFAMRWRPFQRHEFGGNLFSSSRRGHRVIDREIHFGDETYPVNAEINSDLDVDLWDISYTYWVLQSEKNGIGLNGGISGMSIRAGLAARTADGTAVDSESASTDLPVPVLGVEGRHAFTNRLIAQGRVAFLPTVTIDEYSANALVGNASLEYRFFGIVALGASYNYFHVNGEVDRPRFTGDLGVTVDGPEVFVRLVF